MDKIRNFSIIAHINHGKSTLLNCLIKFCGELNKNEMRFNFLDTMELERERGITIKSRSVMLKYCSLNGNIYNLNIIDTPGHVDFSYEVSRSLFACEGVLLLIDASKGVEAQTLANYQIAASMNLKIIPILNKIDLLTADPNRVIKEIKEVMGLNINNIICCSAKTGKGISDVLECIIENIPCPMGDLNISLQALIIDSWFDKYLGVISLIRIKNGIIRKGDKIKVISTSNCYIVEKLGVFTPKKKFCHKLICGSIGWLICSVKNICDVWVGDTITSMYKPFNKVLPVFKKIKPQVYAGFFPLNSNDYKVFSDAFIKFSLNDSSLFYESEYSIFLGSGYRCGFLGLLHMEITKERLEREYNIKILITNPTVTYEVLIKNNYLLYVNNPIHLPSINEIIELREPIAECRIISPIIYLGEIISLCISKRGIQIDMIYYPNHILLVYEIPMSEIIFDFFNKLKSISHGYALLNYSFKFFKCSDLIRIDFCINGNIIHILSLIVHRSNSFYIGRKMVYKLHKLIHRQQCNINIQAVIGKNIISSLIIKQLRKNVTEKCYGGDISRKKKLLKKQKEGKKRMKQLFNIKIPQELFLSLFYINN